MQDWTYLRADVLNIRNVKDRDTVIVRSIVTCPTQFMYHSHFEELGYVIGRLIGGTYRELTLELQESTMGSVYPIRHFTPDERSLRTPMLRSLSDHQR